MSGIAPQGSPLSPLLSNVMLDDLDRELFERGLRFLRYADDVMVFVRSERAANRVLGSVTTFIEKRLKLKVNREKSKVSSVFKVSLLGFGYYRPGGKGPVKIRIDRKALRRLKKEVRRFTSRSWGVSMEHRLEKLERFMTGWVSYFKLADSSWTFRIQAARRMDPPEASSGQMGRVEERQQPKPNGAETWICDPE
ncbi:reverse transcriptase domain-containing protein [Streptomyces sp. NBC_00371]|uniref:reverse transcriptase domain-containing protein n=1 Tax=Streptomyces sp. NBC_00371 TaxID=2975729 RepID=UPI002E25CD32